MNKKMDKTTFLMVVATSFMSLTWPAQAATVAATPSTSPAPAPAPAPLDVNLTQLLSVAGPFSTFLSYLESTKVIDTFQKQANESSSEAATARGVTILAPTDAAFSSLKSPSLKNLTSDQLRSLCLFHGLPQYYSLASFQSLSQLTTFAGGQYTLDFTDTSGTVHISSGWSKTKISSSVFSTAPVALYEVSRVLLPEAIFGTDIPPAPAPEISPSAATVADSPADSPNSPSSSHSSASVALLASSSIWGSLLLALFLVVHH